MNKFMVTFTKAILAGILVAIGGAIYLSIANKTFGAVLFGFALFGILNFDYNLYTGKVGYLAEEKSSYLCFLLIVIFGNFVGTFISGLFLQLGFTKEVVDYASKLSASKLDVNIIRVLVNSIFCGILMFIGADFYRKKENDFLRTVIVFLVVPIFILSKFEHSVANMFYFTVGKAWSIRTLYYLVIMILGNGIGAILFCYLNIIANKKLSDLWL